MSEQDSNQVPSASRPGLSQVALIVGGIAVGVAASWFVLSSWGTVSTDDAFVEGTIVAVSSKVPSHVNKVYAKDNRHVSAGEVLLELDARDFEVAATMAQAKLDAAKAEEVQAQKDLVRAKALAKQQEVSQQQLDNAELRVRTATAMVAASVAALKQTELNLSYTKICAPTDGYVTKKSVEEGAYVNVGQPLLAVVPDTMWVVANFKETQLTDMRPGQKVNVEVDMYPGVSFAAHVDSIQRGTGSKFSMFPPENAAGNYVKVVQRIPVKIVFDAVSDDKYPLRVGMSVVPKVKVH